MDIGTLIDDMMYDMGGFFIYMLGGTIMCALLIVIGYMIWYAMHIANIYLEAKRRFLEETVWEETNRDIEDFYKEIDNG